LVQLPLLLLLIKLLGAARRSPVMTSVHLARALTYASLVSTVEFNSSEISILNLVVFSFPKSQFCRQVKPGGQLIGEGLSPPSQVVPGVLVGDSVVGTNGVGAALVGMTVGGWEEVGVSVVAFDEGAAVGTVEGNFVGADVGSAEGAIDGLPAVGLDEVGVSVVGSTEGDSVGTATCPRFVSSKAPPTNVACFTSSQGFSAH